MRITAKKCLHFLVIFIVLYFIWNTEVGDEEEIRIFKRRSESSCDEDVMWKTFDVTGNMSFPWIPVDKILLHRNEKLSCDDLNILPRVNMSLIPPSVDAVKEVTYFGGTVDQLASDARFHYFIMRAKAFPYVTAARLPQLIPTRCRSDPNYKVPNIVHFIWDGQTDFAETHYLSVRSVSSIHGPTMIIIHILSTEPSGYLWEQLNNDIPCIKLRKIFLRTDMQTNSTYHQGNVLRLEILKRHGGIFVDFGVMVFKPLDDIMSNKVVLGEDIGTIKNHIILAEKNSPFISNWISTFKNYSIVFPVEHVSNIPLRLSKDSSFGVKIINNKLTKPSYHDGFDWMINKNWFIDDNYCAYLYYKNFIPASLPLLKLNISALIHLDSTYGQMVRKSLFGKFQLKILKGKPNKYAELIRQNAALQCAPEKQDRIPKILHYVFVDQEFTYHQYLSLRLAVKNLQPSTVIFHRFKGGKQFDNQLFSRIQDEVKCLKIEEIPDLDYQFISVYKSNMKKRLSIIVGILSEHGGIFLGENTVVAKPLSELFFQKPMVMSNFTIENDFLCKWSGICKYKLNKCRSIASEFLMVEKNSSILKEWKARKPSRSFYKNEINTLSSIKGVSQENIFKFATSKMFYTKQLPDSPLLYFPQRVLKSSFLRSSELEILSSDSAYGKIAQMAFSSRT